MDGQAEAAGGVGHTEGQGHGGGGGPTARLTPPPRWRAGSGMVWRRWRTALGPACGTSASSASRNSRRPMPHWAMRSWRSTPQKSGSGCLSPACSRKGGSFGPRVLGCHWSSSAAGLGYRGGVCTSAQGAAAGAGSSRGDGGRSGDRALSHLRLSAYGRGAGRESQGAQRICQRKGWQVNERPPGCPPRARAVSSISSRPTRAGQRT